MALKWAVTEKFRDYLYYSQEFTVFSDNNPLSYILTTAKLNATGMRWLAELSSYNFSIKYRPGKNSTDCDFLSRHPNFPETIDSYTEKVDLSKVSSLINSIQLINNENITTFVPYTESIVNKISFEASDHPGIDICDLISTQKSDPVIRPIYEKVWCKTYPSKTEYKNLSRKSKLILRYWKSLSISKQGVLIKTTKNSHQIVLPKKYHSIVYNQLHQNMGHLGFEKCYELVKSRFYWPNCESDVKFFITQQCKCIKDKKPTYEQKAPLVNITTTEPFELISIDYLHLDKCKGGFEYVLVVVDHFTKFAQAFPTKNKSGRSAAEKLFNLYFLDFGFPKRLMHDQGQEFENKLFQRLKELSGIKSSRTTPYHPQGNGSCERMNRTLLNMLKTLNESEKRNWKDHIKKLVFAYNNTVHKSTGFTPHFLLFGRDSRLPIDDIFNIDLENKNKNLTHQNFVENWKNAMSSAFKIVNENVRKSNASGKHNYDKKVQGAIIKKGDRVLVRNLSERGGTGKLRSYWEQDIYIVSKCYENLPIFKIEPESNKSKRTRTVHRNLLMKCSNLLPENVTTKPNTCKSKTSTNLPTPEPPTLNTDTDSESEFCYIIRHQEPNLLAGGGESEVIENLNENVTESSNLERSLSSDIVSETDTEAPSIIPERPKRVRKPPTTLVYDKLGVPSLAPK